ncbi:MAG: phosphatidate cytidylyltransferase [Desulfobacterales bacterium]|nr:phosphatidate cytidylyltransferase [Desulfobacterales bacterium]
MTIHTKRVLTTFISIPFLIGIIYFAPSWAFTILILFVALVSLNEFYTMMRPKAAEKIVFFNYLLTALLFCSLLGNGLLYMGVFPFFVIFPLAFFMFKSSKGRPQMGDIGQIILGPFYICLPLAFLAIIARLPQGQMWVFFMLAVIFAGDTCSFYVGRLFGRHKLTQISPGKTWEGALGGLMANVVGAGIFAWLFFPSLSVNSIMVLGVVIGISGQVGDLAESMLKRMSNIKDSGRILPGHGGMLDRIDGFLFAIPVLYIYLNY